MSVLELIIDEAAADNKIQMVSLQEKALLETGREGYDMATECYYEALRLSDEL